MKSKKNRSNQRSLKKIEPMAENKKEELQHSLLAKYVASFFVSLIVSLIVALIVYAIVNIFDKALLNSIKNGEIKVIADIDSVKPESRELYSYITFFVLFIACFIVCCTLLSKKLQRLFVLTDRFLPNEKAVTAVCFSVFFFGLLVISIYFFRWYWIIMTVSVLAIMFLYFFLIHKKKPYAALFLKKHGTGLKAAVCALCVILTIFVLFFYYSTNTFTFLWSFHHFSAYYYSVYDVYTGSTLLVNTDSIYGFYAYLLLPFFKIFGLSFASFSIAMLILVGIILLCVFYILKTITENYLLILLGFFAFVGYMFFYGMGHDGALYLQYLPHRVLSPVVMLAYICRLTKKDRVKGKINILIGYALCSVFLLWNMETGVFSLASYCAFLVYTKASDYERINKKIFFQIIKYAAFAAAAAVLAIGLIILITYIKSGVIINVFSMFTLVGQGFFMRPLPWWPHLFMVIILAYLIASSISVFKLKCISQKENNKPDGAILFSVSVIGILSFIYYLGRSHNYNLAPCTWACIFLAVYFLDYAKKKMTDLSTETPLSFTGSKEPVKSKEAVAYGQKSKTRKSLILPGLYIVLVCVLTIFAVFPIAIPATNTLTQNYIKEKTAASQDFIQNKEFIENSFIDKDSLFLISQNSALYLTEIKKEQKFKYKNNCDWFTALDYENAFLIISDINDIFIISDMVLNNLEKFNPQECSTVFEKYESVAQSGNTKENLMLFSPK